MKVSDSYASLVQGVSEQVPELRRPGQLSEQVNLLPDPVEGLTRRPGSVYKGTTTLGASAVAPGTLVKDWSLIEYTAEGKDYILLYRKAAQASMPVMVVYNKTDNAFLPVVTNPLDTGLAALTTHGVSAITAAGRYVFIAANNTPIQGSSTQLWGTGALADKAAVWVRGPAYNRRFTVTLQKDTDWTFTAGGATAGLTIDSTDARKAYVEFTTASSQYGGTLDTSDIASSDPDYQKKVNDRTNSYTSAVNAWITTAAKGVVPNNIATQLGRISMYNAGTTGSPNWQPRLTGLQSYMEAGTEAGLPVLNTRDATWFLSGVTAISASDDADNSLIRAVCNEVRSTTDVTAQHWYGKVVKIKPSGASDALYLHAVKKDSAQTGTYGDVTWVEGPGKKHTVTSGLFMFIITGGAAYLASSATWLNTITAGDHPTWAESACGDDDSSKMPFFVGRQVTMLTTFQERLVIGCGSVAAISASKDYLNFFRKTTLSVLADDPFEVAPSDGFADVLRFSVLFDKDLVMFGDKRQYGISGNAVLTPTGANMSPRASIPDTTKAQPVAHNGLIFYAQPGEKASSAHQMEVGQTDDSIQSFTISSQLSKYLLGMPVQLEINSKPDMLFVRTSEYGDRIFCFTYFDTQQGRKQDAWYEWRFVSNLGSVMAINQGTDGPLIFFLKTEGGSYKVDVHSVPISGGVSDRPFLDGLRPWVSGDAPSGMNAAFGNVGNLRYQGLYNPTAAELAELQAQAPSETVWLGFPQDGYAVPTNPFAKDDTGKPITIGMTTVSYFVIGFKNTTGFKWELTKQSGVTQGEFNGRIIGDVENMVGVVPFANGQKAVQILEEVRKFSFKIKTVDWFPLTLSSLEWVGQTFNNVRRG